MTNPFLTNQPQQPAQQPPAQNPWPQQPPAPQGPPPGNPWPTQQPPAQQPPQAPPAQTPPQQPPAWPPAGQQPAPAPQAPQPSPAAQSAAQAGFSGPPSSAPATDPFGVPSGPGDGSRIQEDLGAALLVRPTEYVPQMATSKGATDAIRADWIVLNGPNQGQVRSAALIFNDPLIRDLKAVLVGPQKFLVGVLGQIETKGGKTPFIFGQPDDATLTLARQAAQAYGWI